MIPFSKPDPELGPLSDFLLDQLPLLEIRLTLKQPQTVELNRIMQQAYQNPNLPNLLRCCEYLQAYRRAMLN